MSYDNNPVYAPEEYGFIECVATGNLAYGDWEFYVYAVLRKEDGYYLSTDSGCSCPTPWESHSAYDFTGPLTAEQVREEVRSLAGEDISDDQLAGDLERVV
jgi:hypothetical protein